MNKDFNDFLSTISGETLSKYIDKEKKTEFKLDSDGINKFASEILKYSSLQSIRLLELYHNWLNSDKKDE